MSLCSHLFHQPSTHVTLWRRGHSCQVLCVPAVFSLSSAVHKCCCSACLPQASSLHWPLLLTTFSLSREFWLNFKSLADVNLQLPFQLSPVFHTPFMWATYSISFPGSGSLLGAQCAKKLSYSPILCISKKNINTVFPTFVDPLVISPHLGDLLFLTNKSHPSSSQIHNHLTVSNMSLP